MKALIITYYWPPAGGSGVQRWLKFVKYLQDFGIEPIVYTVENANYIKEDGTLINEIPKGIEILKQTIWQPEDLFFWKKKKQNDKQVANLTQNKMLSFVRGNFFIPDPKVFWVKKSVRFLKKVLEERKIDVVISTGPPHSMHLIAQQLKQQTNIKWLADFRDPWSNLYYNKDFNYSSVAKRIHKNLEQKVLQQADVVTTVSKSLKVDFKKIANNVQVITNGFDDEIVDVTAVQLDKKFSISYIGLLPKQSHSALLFKVLHSICKKNTSFKEDLQLNFIGDIANEVKLTISKYNLQNNTSFLDYVSHKIAIQLQKKAQVLLLLIPNVKHNKGILTGKLFEYLKTKRPILAIAPEEGDLNEILQKTNAGIVIDYKNEEKLTNTILDLYKQYQSNNLKAESKNIEQFHRKELTRQMAKTLRNLVN